VKNALNIKYRLAIDSPIGCAISVFLLFISGFIIAVSVMNAGHYGYLMGWDNYFPLVFAISFFGVTAGIEQENGHKVLKYAFFGQAFQQHAFTKCDFENSGKYATAWIVNGTGRIKTFITVKANEVPGYKALIG
jgi:hypothetical protein